MKIYLIRHGQTTGDIEDRYGGDYDDHLTEEGKTQSQTLAEKLKSKGIEIIFASPRIRAQETAQILSTELGLPLETVEDIRERNAYGILTGMVKADAKVKYPEEFEAVKSYKNTIKGAEEYSHFKERIINALNTIAEKNYRTVGIVTHGGPISCFFREILKKDIFGLKDCGFIELNNNNGWELIDDQGVMLAEA